jgi:AraC-like DNA-binding protein
LGQNVDLAIDQLAEQPFDSSSLRINVDGQEMMVSHIRSQDTRWSYVAAIPLSAALHSVYYIRQITIVVSALIILLGLLIITVIAYHNYQPIRNILQVITQRREKQDNKEYGSYRYIQESVIRIVGENKDLSQILENQKPLLIDSIINKIIKGDFASEDEIRRTMNSIQMTFSGLYYTVIVIRFIPHESENAEDDLRQFIYSKAIVRKYIEQCLANVLVYEKDSITMVILMAGQTHEIDQQDAVASVTNTICTVLDEQLTDDYTLAVGRSCSSLLDINQSYREALIMIGFTQAHDHDKVMYYHAIDEASFTYYYPLNVEKKLVTSIKDASLSDLDAVIQSICLENFIKRSISPLMVQQLFADMRSTLIKLMVDIQADISRAQFAKDLETLFMANEESAFFQYYKIISRQIADEFESKRNNRNPVLLSKMLACIDLHYTDSSFSLTMLSETFNLTSVYISRFFKEQTGENFFSYLEKKRMTTAASLLAEKRTSISQIAEKTGYSNAHVFSRAFKRYYSVSPSDYRDQQISSEIKSGRQAI